MPQDLTDDKSTLAQVMAWCRQATSHYLSHCWPRSMSPNVISRPQWVNSLRPVQIGWHFAVFSKAFIQKETFVFWYIKNHWNLIRQAQLTISHHWLRWWVGAKQLPSHYLNQWWIIEWCIYMALSLDGLSKNNIWSEERHKRTEWCIYMALSLNGLSRNNLWSEERDKGQSPRAYQLFILKIENFCFSKWYKGFICHLLAILCCNHFVLTQRFMDKIAKKKSKKLICKMFKFWILTVEWSNWW